MTSLPVVPTKFYQVCRLCLTVVSDTNDLMQLSVFGGRNHNAGCTNATSAQTTNNANEDNSANTNSSASSLIVSASTDNSGNSGVIVKTIRKNEAQISSSPTTNEHHHSANNDSVTNNNDNEAAAGGTTHTVPDDDNNNFKIDGDLQHHSDILERIYTFLSITVSGSSFSSYPPVPKRFPFQRFLPYFFSYIYFL